MNFNNSRVFAEERVQQKIGKEKLARTGFQLGELQQYHHFWSIDEINQYIDYLLRFYGHIATEEKLGRSLEGRPLRAIKISLHGKVDGSRPIIFIDAGIHAREWAAHMTAVHLLRRLIEHSNEHLDVLEDIDWIIIPVVNPDGYVYSHNKVSSSFLLTDFYDWSLINRTGCGEKTVVDSMEPNVSVSITIAITATNGLPGVM